MIPAQRRIVRAAMRGYAKALKAFPLTMIRPKEEMWKACAALKKANDRKNVTSHNDATKGGSNG